MSGKTMTKLKLRKIPKEIKALGSRYLEWPKDGVILRDPGGPPKGMRLSQECGACCLLDYFLDRGSVVTDGVSLSGHLIADLFLQSMVMPHATVEVEKPFQWASKGFSGMDGIVDPTGTGVYDPRLPYQCHLEIKSSSEQNPKPKLNNREQTIRQRIVMARQYGITDKQLMSTYIFIISKSGHQTFRVHGPFPIAPTAEELERLARDIDLRIQVFDDIVEDGLEADPHQHSLLRQLRRGSCTRCFPLEKAEPSDELLDIFDRGQVDFDEWVEYQRLTKWVKERKEAAKPVVPEGQQVETDYFLIRHTESGRLYIDPKNLT